MFRVTDNILRYIEDVSGRGARVAAIDQKPMKAGYSSRTIRRYDLAIEDAGGRKSEIAIVAKHCVASEVRMIEWLQTLSMGPAVPEIIDSAFSTAEPAALEQNWFVSPFFSGRDLTFEDSVPGALSEALGRLHAKGSSPTVDWTWTFNASHFRKTFNEAVNGLHMARLFRQTVPDYREWYERLESAGESHLLDDLTDAMPKVLVHGDMHPGNVIMREKAQPVLIDWGNVSIAPPMLDLANMFQPGSPAWATYMTAYREAGGDIPEETYRKGYLWARAATALQYLPWAASHLPGHTILIQQFIDAAQALAEHTGKRP